MARLHSSLMGLVMLAGCDGPPAPSTILLVTWDTVRADVVGITSAAGCGTPRLDRLAAGGATFTQARSSTPTTLPAHASILTGLHPHRHGARLNGWTAVQADTPSLAEDLQRRGWATAAFISAPVLNANTGLGRGFDVYDDATSFPPGVLDRSAEHSVQEALAWLGGLPADRDALLWVHLYDPHQPWRPPRALVEACEGDLYLAELSYTDAWTGRLFDGLEAQGRLDSAVIAVVADHGEAFGEHGGWEHGHSMYQELLEIPLIISGIPGLQQQQAGLVDVLPTLLTPMNLPFEADGRDLRRLQQVPYRSANTLYGDLKLRAVRAGDDKLIAGSESLHRYDLAADPGELSPLDGVGILEAWLPPPELTAPGEVSDVDGDLESSLRSLGYLE